jgi:PIN domain nuclease of toxin-antitoxin system
MIVLDTQAWLWWTHDAARLSRPARAAIQDAEKSDGLRVSVISVWEIALKTETGKLKLPLQLDEWFSKARSYPNLTVELLTPKDAIESARLPGNFHKDPADRIIIVLARRLGVPIVTSDSLIQAYSHVETIW